MESLKEIVVESLKKVYRSLIARPMWEWCEETLVIPNKENKSKAGRFLLKNFPYQIFFYEWSQRKGKQELVVNKSSRAGVSFCAYTVVAYLIENDPQNVLMVLDDEDSAEFESDKRFVPLLKASGILERSGIRFSDISVDLQDFPEMFVHWRGAKSDGVFDRIEVSAIYLDELRNFKIKNAFAQARERLKNNPNTKLWGYSEPNKKGDEQDKEWGNSSQREMLVHCPHCEEEAEQALIFERLIFSHCFDQEKGWDEARVLKETYYHCVNGCKIQEHERPLLWRRWLSEKKSFTRVRNPDHELRLEGLQVHQLHVPNVPFGETALRIIQADGDPLKEEKVDTAVKARVPESSVGVVTDKLIKSLMDYAPYQRTECPFRSEDVAIALQMIDTQLDFFKTLTVVYDKNMNFAVIDWAERASLDACKTWGAGPILCADGEEIYVEAGVVDEGDGARRSDEAASRRDEVRRWCRENNLDGWMPIRGIGGLQMKNSIRTSEVEMEGYENKQVVLQIVSRPFLYELVYENIKNHKRRILAGHPIMMLPNQIGDTLLKELKGEYMRMKPQEKGSSVMVAKWHKAGPNDYLDCIKYGKGLFMFLIPKLVEIGRLVLEEEAENDTPPESDTNE